MEKERKKLNGLRTQMIIREEFLVADEACKAISDLQMNGRGFVRERKKRRKKD